MAGDRLGTGPDSRRRRRVAVPGGQLRLRAGLSTSHRRYANVILNPPNHSKSSGRLDVRVDFRANLGEIRCTQLPRRGHFTTNRTNHPAEANA
jgi:hypothetical protein